MRWPWQRKIQNAPLPAWIVEAHGRALVIVAVAEAMRRSPELIPLMRPELLAWARAATEALKPAAAVITGDSNVLRFARKAV